MTQLNYEAALRYHEATKHSEISLRMSAHYLDWENKPSPFKTYENAPSIALPRDFPSPTESGLKALKSQGPVQRERKVDLGLLAEILFFSAGLTRKMRLGHESYYMRAASATGALYPIETYVVTDEFPGLKAGVYHFDPLNFALVRLREGDCRANLASVSDETVASSPLTIVFTSFAWRNVWKYEARSYRHWFWDSGVIAANLLATCSAEGIRVKLLIGFVDAKVDTLLGLQEGKEAAIALAPVMLGRTKLSSSTRQEVSPIRLKPLPLSKEEDDYPIIWETNKASALQNDQEVSAWRRGFSSSEARTEASAVAPKYPIQLQRFEDSLSLRDTILRRGSTRRFAQKSVGLKDLSTIIDATSGKVPLDFLPESESLIDYYFIANDVENLPSGSYFYNREGRSLDQLKEGRFRHISGYLCLDQPLFSDASVVFFLMTPLTAILAQLGNRGYRAVQFEAGIRAGKIYLSAYSLHLGASGSTFYDDAVTEFFSPHAKNLSPMIVVGVGVPAYKAKPGKILPQFSGSEQY